MPQPCGLELNQIHSGKQYQPNKIQTIAFPSQRMHIPAVRAQSSRRCVVCLNLISQDQMSEREFQPRQC
jgi:hypothetical protein